MSEFTPESEEPIPVASPLDDLTLPLQKSLTPRLDEDDEALLSSAILNDYHGAITDRAEWESRLAEWEDAYYGRVPEKKFPWVGASNFHVPITMMGIETYKPRLVEGILGQYPPIMAVPTRGVDEGRKDIVEQFMNWEVLSEMDIAPIVAESAHVFLQPGLAVAKTYWKVERLRRKFIREFPVETPLKDVFEALFGTATPRDLESIGEMKWKGYAASSPESGPPLEVVLQLNFLDDDITQTLQVLVEREEVIERPHVDLIDPIDLIGPVKGGSDVQKLPWVQHRVWWGEDTLRRKVLAGRLYKDRVQELIDAGAGGDDKPTIDSVRYRESQDNAEGVDGQGSTNVRGQQWEILEDYRRWDIDDDGLEEEIITWVPVDLPSRILGWDYLDNVYAHGRRPLRVGRFFPVPFRFYGLSYAEMMQGIQDEINAIHNQRVDYATIQNMPFFFYRASATLPPIQQALKPGEGVPVDNPQQDILFPKWQGSPAWAQDEEAILMQHGERLSGLTDLSIGRQPNRVGATRTASGTQTLLSEAGLRFKGVLQEFQRFWTGIFSDVLALCQEYLPPDKEFRVTGRRPSTVRIKDRTQIRGKYDLRLISTSETMNRQRLREDATAIMQATLNPALIQAGQIGIKGVRRAVSRFYSAYGEDPDFYLEPQSPVRSPLEELQMFASGQYVSPVAGEDLQAHITAHEALLMDPVVPPEVKSLITRHLQETQQLQMAQQMAQMLQQRPAQAGQGPQAVQGAQGMGPMPQEPPTRAMMPAQSPRNG